MFKRAVVLVMAALGTNMTSASGQAHDGRAPAPRTARATFAAPDAMAHVGVWWHWMGANVTKEGILADLEYFRRVGVTSATIFGMADQCTPWARDLPNPPTGELTAFTPPWWKLVRYACEQGRRLGVSIGIHNCPGYTSTGGPWVPSQEGMRQLVFDVTNAETQISLESQNWFPLHNPENGKVERPEMAVRRTDVVEIGTIKGHRVAHVPTCAFTQPNQWKIFGLECDKLNPVAVSNHLDHVIGDMKRHLGDCLGNGLDFVLLDSYEAGVPNWTPRMREEFQARRGYDPLPYLPVLGGFDVTDAETAAKFKKDFDQTVRDLFRDVLFKIMHDKLAEVGVAFACEPYGGPFDSRQCARHVDRIMSEFWNNFKPAVGARTDMADWPGPDGKPHNILEAEAFTGAPETSMWDETPWRLKAIGDAQFISGVNRFVFHSNPLQPWGEGVKPGISMGRWGTHFGRTQTWAEEVKAYFDYLARCQALLQWGRPTVVKLDLPDDIGAISRTDGRETVSFIANLSDDERSLDFLPDGTWLDPVTGAETGVPGALAPRASGFLLQGGRETGAVRRAPRRARERLELAGDWRIDFGGTLVVTNALFDWTTSPVADIRYFSGKARYSLTFGCAAPEKAAAISLGDNHGQMTRVLLNGMELGVVWCAPWEVAIPAGLLKAQGNRLELVHANVWRNRLVGDEQEKPDCEFAPAPEPGGCYLKEFPAWFDGKTLANRPSKGRHCFVTWNYFTSESALAPSGVKGPVALLLGND